MSPSEAIAFGLVDKILDKRDASHPT